MSRLLALSLFAFLSVASGLHTPNCVAPAAIHTVSVEAFAKVIKQRGVCLIDVRTAKEYAEGHIVGAVNIDVNHPDFVEKAKCKHRRVAVYCRSGKRSLKAAQMLSAQGVTVYNLDGGILAWQRDGRPIAAQ